MRILSIPFFGLIAALGFISLNVQEQSLAGSKALASRMGVLTASLLSSELTDKPKADIPDHSAFENVARRRLERIRRQPLRRVVEQVASLPAAAVTPKARMIAAIANSDAKDHHKKIANEVLMALPAQCRNTMKNFYVKNTKQKNRGLAGRSVVILDGTVPDVEFRALLVHETGHNWDLGCLTGTALAGKSNFSDGDSPIYKNDPSISFYQISWITSGVQRSNAYPEDFVSGYASYDIFEDYAESFTYFVLQNEVFAARAQNNPILAQKYAWFLDVMFEGKVPHIASGKSIYKNKAPWDTTKLKYVWHPKQFVAQK